MQSGNTDFIHRNELDKTCFQHDMAYGKWKDFAKKTQWDKVVKDKAFKIANDPKYDGYQRRLVSMAYKIFDKKSSGRGVDTSLENKSATTPNYQLENELHRQIIQIFKRRKIYLSFRENIWGADLADMPSLSKYNKGIKYLLCVIDFFSKYVWVVPLKDKRGITIVNAFHKTISKWCKRKKILVAQGGNFYNNLLKKVLLLNILKDIVADRFTRTLENKIFKHMTDVSKNVYFDVLDDIVNKYNNIVHRTIKMKPNETTSDCYAEYNGDHNEKKIINLKSVIVSEYQNTKIFLLKDIIKIGQNKFLSLPKLTIQLRGHRQLVTWMANQLLDVFMKINWKKTSQEKFRIEKLIKRKGDKCYIKWKGYNNSFNSCIDKKDLA